MTAMIDQTTHAWRDLLHKLLEHGQEVRPRDYLTRELLGWQSRVPMARPLVLSPARELGYRFLAAEAAWVASGDNRVATIKPFSRALPSFSDDGLTLAGAYGPPFRDQLGYVARTLAADPSSRQAVTTLWRPRPGHSRDVPCTLALQWLVREGRLHCVASMRSSDAWLGLPYDWATFSHLSAYLLVYLRVIKLDDDENYRWSSVRLGDLHLTAGSQHLYQRDWEPAARVLAEDPSIVRFDYQDLDPAEFADPDDLVEWLWFLAKRTHHGAYGSASDAYRHAWLRELFDV